MRKKNTVDIKNALLKKHLTMYLKYFFVPFAALTLFIFSEAAAQSQSLPNPAEAAIRKLEAEQVEYLLNGKVAEMKKSWAANFTVNNPSNEVQAAATGPIQSGLLTYSKFERNIEKILLYDSVIVVMGNELVVLKTAPKESLHVIGQPIKRRFTNVWMRINGQWLMIARHANNVCSN